MCGGNQCIEGNFGLPSFGYAEARADDLSDYVDFRQSPIAFHTIKAPSDAAHFLNDKSPPVGPDDE